MTLNAAARSNPVDRFFDLTGDESPETRRSKLVSLRTILLLCLVLEATWESSLNLQAAINTLALAVCLLLTQVRRWERIASLAVCAVTIPSLANKWYFHSNHFALFTFVLLLLALMDLSREEDQLLGLQAVRWVCVITFFYTGLQKIIYGTYFHGQFLSWKIGANENFAKPFQWLLAKEELARLTTLDQRTFGSGPYRSSSLPLILMSNLTYVFEMVAPLALLVRKFRPVAIAISLVFVFVIEVSAREYFFGVGFSALLLTFAKGDWIRWLIPLFLAVFMVALIFHQGSPLT